MLLKILALLAFALQQSLSLENGFLVDCESDCKLAKPRVGRAGRKPSFLPSSEEWSAEPVRPNQRLMAQMDLARIVQRRQQLHQVNQQQCSYESESTSSSSMPPSCPGTEPEDNEDPYAGYDSGYTTDPDVRCGDDGCCEARTNWIEDMDFYHTYPVIEGLRKNWHYITVGNFTSNGGVMVSGKMGGYLDTHIYTLSAGQTGVPELDHIKYAIFSDKVAAIPGRNKLIVEWKASAETFMTGENPFGNLLVHRNDPRLASSGFITTDPTTGLSFSFLLTNDRVYIVYSRLPYQRLTLEEPYAAFTYMIPVKIRTCSETHRLRVEFDDAKKHVTWFVDYRQVFKLEMVGNKLKNRTYMTGDYGGYSDEVFPKTIEYGFGSFTYLDQYPTCQRASIGCTECVYPPSPMALVKLNNDLLLFPQYNPQLGMPHESEYFDPQGLLENRLWGQGSESRIYQLSVYQVLDGC